MIRKTLKRHYLLNTALMLAGILVLLLGSLHLTAAQEVTPTASAGAPDGDGAPFDPPGPTLRVMVTPQTGVPGNTVNVTLRLYKVTDLYGLQATCAVDPTVLAGVSHADGEGFNASNSFFVDNGFKPDGQWMVAASRLQPNAAISGNAVAFSLTYTVLKAGSSPVNCAIVAVDINGRLIDLQVVNGDFKSGEQPTLTPVPTEIVVTPPATPTPEQTPPAEITPPPTSTPEQTPPPVGIGSMNGLVKYQNRPDNAAIQVQVFSAADPAAPLAELNTQANGAYSFTDVPAGSYLVKLSAPQHLSVMKVAAVQTDGQALDLGVVTLPAGDTNNDGKIDIADATLVGANFGVSVPPAPNSADINADQMVDIRDLALIGGNYGMQGPVNQ